MLGAAFERPAFAGVKQIQTIDSMSCQTGDWPGFVSQRFSRKKYLIGARDADDRSDPLFKFQSK